ncbi:MAG: DUF4286 family protein [Xanthobacteraceae bacterium]
MTNERGLLLFMTDVNSTLEDEFNRWYEEEHLPERMAVPGFINARRFRCIEGGPRYLALYDLETPDVLRSPAYLNIVGANKSPWTLRMEKNFSNARRNVYTCIGERKR